MHPAHMLFEEVTASNLHKLDENCNHVVPSDEMPHKFAFPFHKGIYDAFPAAQCVMHLHTKAVTAVAMQDQGLIPGNQYALWLGPIGYHNYEGLVSTPEEGERLAKNFGEGQVVLQKGHGFVLWGHSVAEAYMLAFLVIRACEVQIASGAGKSSPMCRRSRYSISPSSKPRSLLSAKRRSIKCRGRPCYASLIAMIHPTRHMVDRTRALRARIGGAHVDPFRPTNFGLILRSR